jgi:hypothetical protein
MQKQIRKTGDTGQRARHAPRIFKVCPHCWEVNPHAVRLCGRCGADMTLVLQESGGLRHTAAVQSPVPVSVRSRLSVLQRVLLLGFVILLAIAHVIGALHLVSRRGHHLPQPLGTGQIPATLPAAR